MPILQHTPADVTRSLMITLGLGTSPTNDPLQDWPIYKGTEPNTPDEVITVYDDVGTDDGRHMGSGEVFGMYGLLFRVRSRDDSTGWLKANEILTTLSESAYDEAVVLGAYNYNVHSFDKWSDVMRLGKEVPSSKRHTFTVSCVSKIVRTS